MRTSAAITRNLAAAGIERKGERAVFTIIGDDHNVHCMTEDQLDEWFRSQTAERKAEIFDRELDGDTGEFALHDGMLRTSLADVVDRINGHARQFRRTYRKAMAGRP